MSEFILNLADLEPVNKNPYPFTPLQLSWLEALESGNYKQSQGYLCTLGNEYCCLGIMAELAGAIKKKPDTKYPFAYYMKGPDDSEAEQWSSGTLSYGLRTKALLRSDLGEFAKPVFFPGLEYGKPPTINGTDEAHVQQFGHTSLSCMNDCRMIPTESGEPRGFNFKEIAAYIRHDPWNVFMPPPDAIKQAFEQPPNLGGA